MNLEEDHGRWPAPPGTADEERALLALYLRQLRMSIPVHLLVGMATAWLALRRHSPMPVLTWLAVLMTVVLLRRGAGWHDARQLAAAGRAAMQRMRRRHVLLAALCGAAWGWLPWLGFDGQDAYLDFFVGAVVFGIVGGAFAPLSPLRWAYPAYACASLLPLGARAISIGGEVYTSAGLVMLLYFAVVQFYQHAIHLTVRDSVRMRCENARLVARLAQESQAAQQASRAKSRFLAGISHDLKHPVQALGLYLGYLKTLTAQEAADGGLPRVLGPMEHTLLTMSQLMSRLIQLARLDAGDLKPARTAVALETVFACCASKFLVRARDKGLRLRFAPCRFKVQADPGMLQSILDNLVANAVDGTAGGGIVVGVRRRAGSLAIEVWDSGAGIPAARAATLFDPYRRFDDTTREDHTRGLGLALVKRQSELLGWQVDFRSQPGRGSVFRVVIPPQDSVTAPAATGAAPRAAKPPDSTRAATAGPGRSD